MKICFQKNKRGIYSLACPEVKLRALAADQETKLLTASCRQAIKYAKEGLPAEVPQWFDKRFKDFCKNETKERGDTFAKKIDKQKLLLFSEDQKGKHPFINFSASGYDTSEVTDKKTNTKKKGPWRKQKYVHLSGLVAIDLDNVDDAMAIYKRWEEKVDFKALKIYLIYLTPRMGLRVVFRCEASRGNLIDNQLWMCKQLCVDGIEVEPDGSCKDSSRGSFLTSDENFLYDNLKELYEDEPDKDFIEKYEPEYRAGRSGSRLSAGSNTAGTDPLRSWTSQAAKPSVTSQTQLGQSPDVRQSQNVQFSMFNLQSLKWRGYDLQSIIDQRYADKLPCAADSNRHTESLKLATDLMLMLDGDKTAVQRAVEAQPWVQEIIAERNENVSQTVESAAGCIKEKEKKYAGSLPSKAMQEAVKAATGLTYQEIVKGSALQTQGPQEISESDIDRYLWDWGEQIEALFDDFPILKDVCKGLKRNQYPAALVVAGGLMMTLMTRCTYRFYHRPEELRRLNNSTLIIGDPASGKSFATRLYKLLIAPIIEADKAGKEAINAYREEMRTKGANKEKPKKPKVIVRVHPARTSNAQFIQDMVNAKENVDGVDMQLHMLTFDTELDNTVTVQKGGSWIDKQSMELKAFHNEEDGQAYSNNDSILQDFVVTWNYIYTGTPIALKKKVNAQNFGSGLATRLTCIPLPATNFEMMTRESAIDLDSDERLKEWAIKLDRMKGELTVQKIVDELYDWTARRMADAKENESKADEMLLKRCAYHGLNFSAPFVVMRHWDMMHQEGNYWCGEFETDDVDWKLAELIVNMQYACQRHYFGALAETYFDNKVREAAVNVQRKQKTIEDFNRLPEEFTAEEVMKCLALGNLNTARMRIKRFLKDHLVERGDGYVENGTTKARYKKTGKIML